MSKRYVDAEILKNKILNDMAQAEREGKDLNGYTDALFHLKTIPTADVVEVVRCRDCKYCHHYVTPTLERYECYYYGCSDEVVNYVEPMHYCSYGQRREE